MSNIPPINDKLFLEAYNIISSNKSKANSLRQSLLQNISCDNDPNSKVIGFLGELEYDLKSLYDIIKDIQFSQNDNQDNYYNEPINEEKKGIGKTYSITSEKSGNGNKNNFSKINNYYINSPINKELNKSMQRSTSCKSYILNNEENNHGKPNLIKNKLIYRNNDFGLSKGKSPKLNFDYDAYFTDYTLNKTGKNSVNSYFDFLNKNIDKYEKSPEMNKQRDNNKNENIENNEFNKNINDFNFQNQSIELKDKIFVLNSQSDKNENVESIKKENEEKNEEKDNVNNDLDINQEKENGKKISDLHFDSLEESVNNQNNKQITNINNLNNFNSEKEQDNENNENAENINESNGQIQNNQEINNFEENGDILNNNQNMNGNENKYENKETNTDMRFNKDIEDINSSEKKDALVQTNNQNEKEFVENNGNNEEQKEKINENEKENENKEFFEEKLKNGNQFLESDGNTNNKKVKKNKNYNQKILNNKNILIQEQKQNKDNKVSKNNKNNIENKEKKKQKNSDKKNLNQKLLEKEMNEIKRRLELKENLKKKKELENQENFFGSRIKSKNIKIQKLNEMPEINRKLSPNRSIQYYEKAEKFNTPTNNDICSQLLQAAFDNEKQLILVPFVRQKEKIKKTFPTIGKSNGISYSEYRVIKGDQSDNNNILNIIRDDDRRSLSKRKEYSDSSSMRRSNFHNLNAFNETNSEFKL